MKYDVVENIEEFKFFEAAFFYFFLLEKRKNMKYEKCRRINFAYIFYT